MVFFDLQFFDYSPSKYLDTQVWVYAFCIKQNDQVASAYKWC